jgi:hypothetical protein
MTVDDLRKLLRGANDEAGHHVLWVTFSGEVQLTRIPHNNIQTIDAESELAFRFPSFPVRTGQVGLQASEDEEWVSWLHRALRASWDARARGLVDLDDPL